MDDGWADGNGVITMSLVVGTSACHAPRPRTTNQATNFINNIKNVLHDEKQNTNEIKLRLMSPNLMSTIVHFED